MKPDYSQTKQACQCKYFYFFYSFLLTAFVIFQLVGCNKNAVSIKKPPIDKSIGECVVLLHGMGRTLHSMDDMQEALVEAGFHTVNFSYPSTTKNIESIAKGYFPLAFDQCLQFAPKVVHFVTHSLGGIVLRKAVKDNRPPKLGRVVMLSPPNHGSAVVDTIGDWWFYEWLNGPAGQQLSTASDSVPNQLGPVDYPVGIITGDRHAFFDSWFSSVIPGEDDGKVSVEGAKLEGMSNFLVVHQSHPYIMNADNVQRETIHFLKHGKFSNQEGRLSSVSSSQ